MQVLPAQAGVILHTLLVDALPQSTPRVSGGDPLTETIVQDIGEYSPRKRG